MSNIQDKKYFDDISEAIKVYEELRKYKNVDLIDARIEVLGELLQESEDK